MKNRPLDRHSLFPSYAEGHLQALGILNITPDSFSDAGRFFSPDRARRQAIALVKAGAAAIDIGAESTRPGAEAIATDEQWARLQPVLDGLVEEIHGATGLRGVLSIDTRDARVAARALEAGVSIVNDVSGGSHDPDMLSLVAEKGALFILMHMRGEPKTMREKTDYGTDFMGTLCREIEARLLRAYEHGVRPEQILLDPGIGFAKTASQSWEILRNLEVLSAFKLPILVGPSRKSFLRLPNEDITVSEETLDRRTLVAATLAVFKGARFLRLHNVEALWPALRMLEGSRKGSA